MTIEMKDSEILDIPTKQDVPIKPNRWKPALLAILFLFFYQKNRLQNIDHRSIIYMEFCNRIFWILIPNIFPFLFVTTHRSTSIILSYLLGNIVGVFLKSLVLGNLLSIGVFQFIKNKNWAMLVLMIFASWMLLTTFTIQI